MYRTILREKHKIPALAFILAVGLSGHAFASTAGIDTTLDSSGQPNPQYFGLGGQQTVGVWSTSGLAVTTPISTPTLGATTVNATNVNATSVNLNSGGALMINGATEAFTAQSANTVAALKDIQPCASGQSLTKTGPNAFACTTDGGGTSASTTVAGGANSGTTSTIIGQGTVSMYGAPTASKTVFCRAITFAPWNGPFTAVGNLYYLAGEWHDWTGWVVFFNNMNMAAGTGEVCIDTSDGHQFTAVSSENVSYVITGLSAGTVPQPPPGAYQSCNGCYSTFPSN